MKVNGRFCTMVEVLSLADTCSMDHHIRDQRLTITAPNPEPSIGGHLRPLLLYQRVIWHNTMIATVIAAMGGSAY